MNSISGKTKIPPRLVKSSLSLEAIGLMASALSEPDGFVFSQAWVRQAFGLGHEKSYRLIKELRDNNFIFRKDGYLWLEGRECHVGKLVKPKPNIKAELAYIYIISAGNMRKIGISANVESRIKCLQCSNASALILEFSRKHETQIVCEAEEITHRLLGSYKINGEWFDISPEGARLAVDAALLKAGAR